MFARFLLILTLFAHEAAFGAAPSEGGCLCRWGARLGYLYVAAAAVFSPSEAAPTPSLRGSDRALVGGRGPAHPDLRGSVYPAACYPARYPRPDVSELEPGSVPYLNWFQTYAQRENSLTSPTIRSYNWVGNFWSSGTSRATPGGESLPVSEIIGGEEFLRVAKAARAAQSWNGCVEGCSREFGYFAQALLTCVTSLEGDPRGPAVMAHQLADLLKTAQETDGFAGFAYLQGGGEAGREECAFLVSEEFIGLLAAAVDG